MDSEQFFLKWNNFESNLASGFADLLQREAMVDVTLAAEGKIVQAHKIILSICSSYFKNMFQVNPCQHPIVVLKDVRFQELTDMLDFMYKGEANVRQEDLPSFLKLAETLKVKGLAGHQGDNNENSRKRNFESQISNLTKDPLPFVKESSNDFLVKDTMVRKKTKRCASPGALTEMKDPPSIKLEINDCDNTFLRNTFSNSGQNPMVKEERLSDNSFDSYGESHIVHEHLDIEKNAGPSTVEENCETAPQETRKETKEYSFMESCFGGHLLVLNGYSYRRKSITSGRSYWFCCSAKCPAKGILLADGKFQETNTKHNHKSDFETIKKKEKLVQLKKLALQLDISGKEILEALEIKDDVKKHLGFIRTWRRRDKKRNQNLPFAQTSCNVGLNYKRLASRIPSKEMLLHSGYLFRQDSINPFNEKCKYWRCRVKQCKARAKTDAIGNLTILQPLHNHPLESSEGTTKNLREMEYNELMSDNQDLKSDINSKLSLGKTYKYVGTLKQEKCKIAEEAHAIEEPNSTFCTGATDAESFNFEKLMAETLAETYCVPPEFGDSLNLLKNE